MVNSDDPKNLSSFFSTACTVLWLWRSLCALGKGEVAPEQGHVQSKLEL